MTRQETLDFVQKLTAAEQVSLLRGLMQREQAASLSMAITLASALEANLRVAGRHELARQVSAIHETLYSPAGQVRV